MIAQTACSRDEPVPKFGPATRIEAPANRPSLRTKARSSRHDEKRPLPHPGRAARLAPPLRRDRAEGRAGGPRGVEDEAPVVPPRREEALAEAGALDALEPLGRDDLVGV